MKNYLSSWINSIYNMADITMSVDDTLELDAVIKEWNDPDNIVEQNNDKFEISGLTTHTKILNPLESGTYDISVNGQKLTVEVLDSSILIEGFEEGDLSYYTSHNGTSGYYEGGSDTITSDKSYEGSNSLRIYLKGQNGNRKVSTDSLTKSPSRGDNFKYYTYAGNSNIRRAGVIFATDDPTDGLSRGYNIRTNFSENNFGLSAIHSNVSSSVNWNPPTQEWIEIRVDFGTTEIKSTAYDSTGSQIAQNRISDSEYDSGWWTWYGNTNSNSSGGSVYFDNLRK